MKHSSIRPPKAMGLNTTELPPEKPKHWKIIKQRKIIGSLCLQWGYEYLNGWIFHIFAKSISSGVKDQ